MTCFGSPSALRTVLIAVPTLLLVLASAAVTHAGMNGACCVDGVCSEVDQTACDANGGFFFLGASCDGFDCGIFACCRADGTCVDTNEAMCLAAGGDFVGGVSARNCADGVMCTPVARGACCDAGGMCTDALTLAECSVMSGQFEGPGTTCADSVVCAFACCLPSFQCVDENAADCATDGGNFVGGTNRKKCEEILPCPGAPDGACCIGGVCVEVSLAECLLIGGTYGGNSTTCPPFSQGPCGACCNSGACTDVVSRGACEAGGGSFAGAGSVCDVPPDNFCALGACCKQDGLCAQTTMLGCDSIQGNFSAGQSCAAVSCTGACCFENGTCAEMTEADCVSDEVGTVGDYRGDGTVCSTPQICSLTGACCFADGSCAVLTRADCENTALTPPNGNGNYRGDLTVCDPSPCGPTGACCFPNGQCVVNTQAECNDAEGGTYQGDGAACTPGLCGAVSGACCFADETCQEQTRADCEAGPMSGTYQGDFAACTAQLCILPTGACCSEGTCEILSQAECVLRPGTYQGDGSGCDTDGDSVIICNDQCPGTPAGQQVDANGCTCLQLDPTGDDDADGVLNCNDSCPNTAAGARVDGNGCACDQPMSSALDGDGDGVPDACDDCSGTPNGESIDDAGCACSQRDILAPMIMSCPESVTVALDRDCHFVVPDLAAAPSVEDNCTATANLHFTTEPQDLSTLPFGDNTVVVTVTDESGNSAECTITVTIEQGDCPEPGCAPLCGMGSPFVILVTIGILLVRRVVGPSRKRKKRPDRTRM